MSRLVRGIGARRGQALTLLVLGVVVVAGCLVATTFSQLTDTPPGSAGVLLLLGAAALAAQAAAAARGRRPEIALAQIRGRHGMGLFAYLLAEPVAVLIVATVLGVIAGREIAGVAARAWLTSETASSLHVTSLGWLAVAVAVVVSLVAVVAGSWRSVREPLIEQLDAARRPKPAATLMLFGQTLVVVAAVLAGYQAARSSGARGGWAGIADPALLSPVLLGLAGGQVAAWGLRLGAAVVVPQTSTSGKLSTFLAVRRLARRSDTAFGTRLVIAAAVVAAVTLNATAAVASWRAEGTRLELGGPQRFTVEAGALAAYNVSHAVDPDGRWLMALVGAPDESEPYRRVFADTVRWREVVGSFLATTAAAGVAESLPEMAGGTDSFVAHGDRVSVDFDTEAARQLERESLTVTYVNARDQVQLATLTPKDEVLTAGTTQLSARLHGCAAGCVVYELDVDGRAPRGSGGALIISSIDFGGLNLLEQASWTEPSDDSQPRVASQRDGVLRVDLLRFAYRVTLVADLARDQLAAVATPGLTLDREHKQPVAYSIDGASRPVHVVGTAPGLPLVGRQGMLLDLASALTFGGRSIAEATAYVVARADTPAAVLSELTNSGLVSSPARFESLLDAKQRSQDAQGVRLYALLSLFAALIAGIGLLAALGGQREEREQEAASLRVSGVPSRHIAAAYRVEAGWLAGCTFVVVAVGGWIASRLSIGALPLVTRSSYDPVLSSRPSLGLLLAVAAGAAALVGLLTLAVTRRIAGRSPPSSLRGGDGQ